MTKAQAYELRLFDKVILTFSIDYGFDGDTVVDLGRAGDDALLPPGLQPTPDGVWKWLSARVLPPGRRYADTLCIMMGIRPGDVERILAVGLGLSLNDSYWVCPVGFDGRFADYNLYENGFSDVLAAVAYTGHLDLGSDDYLAETDRHLALGATELRRTPHWVTLQDPSGRTYCVTRHPVDRPVV